MTEYVPADSSYLSSALGDALESGLTLREVFIAASTVYREDPEDGTYNVCQQFDAAIQATIHIGEIKKNGS